MKRRWKLGGGAEGEKRARGWRLGGVCVWRKEHSCQRLGGGEKQQPVYTRNSLAFHAEVGQQRLTVVTIRIQAEGSGSGLQFQAGVSAFSLSLSNAGEELFR